MTRKQNKDKFLKNTFFQKTNFLCGYFGYCWIMGLKGLKDQEIGELIEQVVEELGDQEIGDFLDFEIE